MRVTLKDLAEKTGVSVNTVSHALAGKTDISAATRDRVLAAAAELGYIRNRAASGLRSGKSRFYPISGTPILPSCCGESNPFSAKRVIPFSC